MKEAIGNSFLMTLAIVFSFLIMALIIGIMAYTKAYKVKNKIVGVVEKYNGYTEETEDDIYQDLREMGYQTNTDTNRSCPKLDASMDEQDYTETVRLLHDIQPGRFEYCLYQVATSRGYYYHTVVFTHFDVPFLGQWLVFQVKGDSQVIYQNFDGERWRVD